MTSPPEAEPVTLRPVAGESQPTQAETRQKDRRKKDRPSPGSRGQMLARNWRLVSAAVLLVAGIVMVLLGWYGAANTNILTEQIPYLISGGLLGLGLIVVAGVLASAAALERENRELRADLRRLFVGAGRIGPTRLGTESFAKEGGSPNGQLYVVPGGRSYHLAGCPILEGKAGVKEIPPEEAPSYSPCKLCEPD